jgi:hypothetical protein
VFDHRLALALGVGLALVAVSADARAQEMEPRAYSNSPVGFNFFVASYAYSRGGLSLDPSLPVEDAKLHIHSGIFVYARALDLWGMSGKLDIIVPYSELSGTGTLEGQPAQRQVTGFGDPRFRLSVNFYGAPALSMKDFRTYKRDLVIGASVQMSAPSGQYDSSKAINLGTNRWWIKPDLGFSKAFGPLTLDVTASVTFYSDNDNFLGGQTLAETPIYAAQANLSYDVGRGVWVALTTTYFRGGRTTLNGNESDAELGNARAGALVAFPVTQQHSIKLNVSRGLYTRFGTDFLTLGIAWQYRWGPAG